MLLAHHCSSKYRKIWNIKKVIKTLNGMSVSKCGKNLYCWVNYSFHLDYSQKEQFFFKTEKWERLYLVIKVLRFYIRCDLGQPVAKIELPHIIPLGEESIFSHRQNVNILNNWILYNIYLKYIEYYIVNI